MEKRIEHPKIFISYAWSTDEYVEKVLEFAKRLVSDGIDVLIDKWSLKHGSDTVSFMEKCVNDKTVDFVIMLLDETYEKKANNKTGGVGIETQIISNEVYKNVDQNKFIPIIFQRNKNGDVCIPTYLKTRFYYDLTGKNVENEYVALVKHIYGVDICTKPELGNKPSWVDDDNSSIEPLKFNIMNSNSSIDFIEDLFLKIKTEEIPNSKDANDVITSYKSILGIRNALIEYFSCNVSNSSFLDRIMDFYEDLKVWNDGNDGLKYQIWESFVHETFIYLISILFKCHKYSEIYTIINKTYFKSRKTFDFQTFFYTSDNSLIDISKKNIDDSNYYSGVAQLWIENIYEPKLNKDDFVFADTLLFNLSTLLLDSSWSWFPITYVYKGGRYYNGPMSLFAIRFKSKYELKRFKDLFGVNNIEEIKDIFVKRADILCDNASKYKYSSCFERPDIILNYLEVSEIGSLR